VALPYPSYSVQEEGTLEFEFVIDPQGNVQYVKLVGVTDKIGLKEAGISAISRWKFTPSPGAGPQRVRVKIKFKLKG
jgi:TonB family protein